MKKVYEILEDDEELSTSPDRRLCLEVIIRAFNDVRSFLEEEGGPSYGKYKIARQAQQWIHSNSTVAEPQSFLWYCELAFPDNALHDLSVAHIRLHTNYPLARILEEAEVEREKKKILTQHRTRAASKESE